MVNCSVAVVSSLLVGVAWGQPSPPEHTANLINIVPIVINVTPGPQTSFNMPGSIYVVTRRQVSKANQLENLSEDLRRVPGIDIQNRENYAEGLRITSRGFGAQTAFGVRNVKLFIDGMPLTAPDGTSDSEDINLGDVSRIEVLSGPFSALYGNAAGGVIQVFSRHGSKQPTIEANLSAGSFGSWRTGFSYGGQLNMGPKSHFNYMTNASNFYTNGYRVHSSAWRQQFTGRYQLKTNARTTWTLLVDAVNEPSSQDPLGLTAAQYHADPRQAGTNAQAFNTRKTLRHNQTGIAIDRKINLENSVHIMVYEGTHTVLQYLPFTGSYAQSGGGVINLNRIFGGIDTHWTNVSLVMGVPVTTIAGIDFNDEVQHRKGFVNNYGIMGELRRNENDVASNVDEYVQTQFRPSHFWSFDIGLRNSNENFSVQDLYVTSSLTSDSGSLSYHNASLAAGAIYHLTPQTNLFVDYGQGFETPTLDQLAYLPGGNTGLNAALKPSLSNNYEVGTKSFITKNIYLKIALYNINTSDAIVVASSQNGRTSYMNAGDTVRNGVDASVDNSLPDNIELYAAYSYINAYFKQGNIAGNHLPGVPSSRVYLETDWHDPKTGFYTTLDGQWETRLYVDNQNSAYAGGYFSADWAAGFKQHFRHLGFNEFLRVNNVLNRPYIGSVIIADSNQRYYEPAPGRNFIIGVTGRYQFN
jgi:iron complex outermembrane receptor protein